MVKFHQYLFGCVVVLTLTQCKNHRQGENEIPFFITALKKPLFLGEWQYTSSLFYSANLKLTDNGTFTFHSQNCFGHTFTQGKWTILNGTILTLMSDTASNYTKKIIGEKLHLLPKQKKERFIFTGFDSSSVVAYLNPSDTITIFLNEVKLNLQNDTLYCLTQNRYLQNHKFTLKPI